VLTEYFKLAVRNVGKRKKRAALTMLGIFIGIAAVVALVSLGQGLQGTINAQFEKIGADKIMVQAKEVAYGGQFAPGQLSRHEIDVLEDVNGVSSIAGLLFRSSLAEFNNVQRAVTLMSIPEKAKEAELVSKWMTLEAAEGRSVTHKDKGKVIVGWNVAKKNLFGKEVRVGDKLLLGGVLFDVVGVAKRIGDPLMDGGISLPESDARLVLDEDKAYSQIVIQTGQGVNADDVAERVEKTLRKDRHQKEGKEDFSVQTSTELIASFNTVFNIIQVVFVGIAAISLLVGGIGIMNVMFTAVLERTREIGVMKAIGARNSDVLSLFLIESGLLGIAGGVIGIILGAGISKSVEIGANAAFGPGTITAVFPIWLIVGALVFSFVVGALSGVLPARRASKLRPVEALRYE